MMGSYLKQDITGKRITFKALICLGLCLIHASLFAIDERASQVFDGINKHFGGNSDTTDQQFGQFFLLITAGVVLVLVVGLAYQLFMQSSMSSAPETSWGLYKKLCRVHRLSMSEKYVVRKLYRLVGLEDPLPLFVEPNYLKQILTDTTMIQYHATVQNILHKLFDSGQTIPQSNPETFEQPTEAEGIDNRDERRIVRQERNIGQSEAFEQTRDDTDNISEDTPTLPFGRVPFFPGHEKQSTGATKVLLNPIPGQAAFSSLLGPMSRISSEIAATAIRHNLSDGGKMNERTYDGIGGTQKTAQEPQTPLFPKSHVPSPDEMLTEESGKTQSSVSPTPQYLQSHKEAPFSVLGKRQNDIRHHRTLSPSQPSAHDHVTLLETMVMER